jgi:hypothetical protein
MSNSLNPGERLMPNKQCTSQWCVYTLALPIGETTPRGDSLTPGGRLDPRDQLRSPNSVYALTMQDDGLLVLSGGQNAVAVPLNGAVPGSYAELRSADGNLVIYVPDGSCTTWESGTHISRTGREPLIVENGGRVRIGPVALPFIMWTPRGDRLPPGGRLNPRDQLRSPNSVYALTMQDDGLLVFSSEQNAVAAPPPNEAVPGSYAELRSADGNLVISVPDGSRTTWESGPRGPGELILHETGSITIGTNILV